MASVAEPASKKAKITLTEETDRVPLTGFADCWEFEYDQAYWDGVGTLRIKVDESRVSKTEGKREFGFCDFLFSNM